MRNQLTTAYVLHRVPYRETSYLVDLLTVDFGRVRGVAKGVRGSKGDRKSLLQSFQALTVVLSGRNDLKNIGRVEACSSRSPLQDKALYCAMYVNELLTRALPESLAVEAVFDEYQRCLQILGAVSHQSFQGNGILESTLRDFELLLLNQLGLLPDMNHCADSMQPIHAQQHYTYVQERGFISSSEDNNPASVFWGADILAMADQQWTEQSLRCAKRFCRLALLPVLGAKPLKSRELFNAVR